VAITVSERGEAGMRALARQLLVERDAPPQHAVENFDGDPSGGEAGDFRLRGRARSRHSGNIAMNCGRVANGSQKNSWAHSFTGVAGGKPRYLGQILSQFVYGAYQADRANGHAHCSTMTSVPTRTRP
jgi:hypothetical protein